MPGPCKGSGGPECTREGKCWKLVVVVVVVVVVMLATGEMGSVGTLLTISSGANLK